VSELSKDRVFAEPLQRVEAFEFNDTVAAVFDDMIGRSVPGYRSIVLQSGLLAAQFCQPNVCCYDLGASLGASTLAMRHQIEKTHATAASSIPIIAIDNSEAMVNRMRARITKDKSVVPVEIELANLVGYNFLPHRVAVMNFTLQFIPLAQRPPLLIKIAAAMKSGGVLILSEKIAFENPDQQQLHTSMYENYKRANGYSELEISQKRDALEDVLIPETLNTHKQRLRACGFSSVEVWFQCFNFVSLVAIR